MGRYIAFHNQLNYRVLHRVHQPPRHCLHAKEMLQAERLELAAQRKTPVHDY